MREILRTWVIGPVVYGVSALPLAIVGKGATAARIRERWLGVPSAATTWGSVAASVPALPLALLAIYLVYAGELYPLRPDTIAYVGSMFTGTDGLQNAWGGPTLAGAWAVHAAIAAGGQIAIVMLLAGLGRIGTRTRVAA